MNTLGFTGTRSFTRNDLHAIQPLQWEWMAAYDSFVTGACIGFDAIVGWELTRRFPDHEHTVIVPADRSRVAPWWERRRLTTEVKVIEMPDGTSYRDRNLAIVTAGDALFYAAAYPEDHPSQIRSGTWQTVRLARKCNMLITGVTLNP